MRFPTLLTLAASAAFLTGCGPAVSIHPLYTAQDLFTESSFEGRWSGEDGEIWQIQKSSDGYEVTVFRAGDSPSLEAFNIHLLRLKDAEYLDATSKSVPSLGINGHLFAKISLEGDDLRVALLNDDWLKKTIQAGLAPAFVEADGGGPVILTASTADLQRFILLHASDPDAWDSDGGAFHRLH